MRFRCLNRREIIPDCNGEKWAGTRLFPAWALSEGNGPDAWSSSLAKETSMIEFELLKDAGVLVVKPKSALSADDFSEPI